MIAIQVAAGIILAYVIIVNQTRILGAAKLASRWSVVAAFLALLGWFGSLAFSTVTDKSTELGKYTTIALSLLGRLFGMFAIFGLALLGASGLAKLLQFSLGSWFSLEANKEEDNGPHLKLALLAVANFALVALAGTALSVAGFADWFEKIDKWSWANGFADAGSLIVILLFGLWPWLPVLAFQRGVAKQNAELPKSKD